MSTHVNAFKDDLAHAIADAHKALGNVEAAFSNLVIKYETDTTVPATATVVTPDVTTEVTPEDSSVNASASEGVPVFTHTAVSDNTVSDNAATNNAVSSNVEPRT